jgi:hypothetical protein
MALPADLTMSKRPGNSYQIEIHFAVFNIFYFPLRNSLKNTKKNYKSTRNKNILLYRLYSREI